MGAIKPRNDILKEYSISEKVSIFLSEYRKNHIIYNKQPLPNDFSDSDDEYYHEKNLKNLSDDPNKKSYVISQDVINKIIQDKEKYKLPKSKYRPEVDEIFVELVGKNNKN